MTDLSFPVFGFAYKHAGQTRHFDIAAPSREEAHAILAEMASAQCIGQLHLSNQSNLATEPEIEITEKMIDAGVAAYYEHARALANGVEGEPIELVVHVFHAMCVTKTAQS
jgi:hypothetical protein